MINFYNLIKDDTLKPKLKLVKKYNYNKNVSLEDIVILLNESEELYRLFVEHAYVIALDNKMNIIGINTISIGDAKGCIFYQKEILTFLLLTGADRYVLVHNHPSDILEPSSNDLSSTYSIQSISQIIGIEMEESIIVCKSGWYCIKSKIMEEYDGDIENVF